MLMIDKRKDTEILKSMGADKRLIQKIFMNEDHQLVYLGENSIFGDVIGKVKYCPKCGKKLEDNEGGK